MARAWGRADLGWAVVPPDVGHAAASVARHSREDVTEYAKALLPQVEGILTGKQKRMTSERKS